MATPALQDKRAMPFLLDQRLSFSPVAGALCHFLLFVVMIWPLAVAKIPPLTDLPMHIARMHILATYEQSPALQQNYTVNRETIIPYKAMPTLVLPLTRFVDVYTASKLFVLLGMALTVAGVVGLQIVSFGRVSVLSLFAQPFLFAAPLGWGFVTFTFSIGLMLCLYCVWIRIAAAPYLVRLATLGVMSTLLFFSHLISVGFFAMLIGAQATAGHRWFSWGFFKAGLRFAPGFLPAVLLWTKIPEISGLPAVTDDWQPWKRLFTPVAFSGGQAELQLFCLSWFVGVLILSCKMRILPLPLPALRRATLVVGLVSLATPFLVLGIALMDQRAPYLLMLLLLGSVGFTALPSPALRRQVLVILMLLGGAFSYRQQLIAQDIAQCDGLARELVVALRALPAGTSLLATGEATNRASCGLGSWHWSLAKLAVVERDVFTASQVSGLFEVTPSEQTKNRDIYDIGVYMVGMPSLAYVGAFDSPDPATRPKAVPKDLIRLLGNWREKYPYIVDFDFGKPQPITGLNILRRGSFFTIYQVTPLADPSNL